MFKIPALKNYVKIWRYSLYYADKNKLRLSCLVNRGNFIFWWIFTIFASLFSLKWSHAVPWIFLLWEHEIKSSFYLTPSHSLWLKKLTILSHRKKLYKSSFNCSYKWINNCKVTNRNHFFLIQKLSFKKELIKKIKLNQHFPKALFSIDETPIYQFFSKTVN